MPKVTVDGIELDAPQGATAAHAYAQIGKERAWA